MTHDELSAALSAAAAAGDAKAAAFLKTFAEWAGMSRSLVAGHGATPGSLFWDLKIVTLSDSWKKQVGAYGST